MNINEQWFGADLEHSCWRPSLLNPVITRSSLVLSPSTVWIIAAATGTHLSNADAQNPTKPPLRSGLRGRCGCLPPVARVCHLEDERRGCCEAQLCHYIDYISWQGRWALTSSKGGIDNVATISWIAASRPAEFPHTHAPQLLSGAGLVTSELTVRRKSGLRLH